MTAPIPEQSGEITQEDVERARAAWTRAQVPQFKNLLDAEAQRDTESE